MFGSFSLNKKLSLAFTGCALGLLLVGVVGYTSLYKVSQTYEHVTKINLGNVENLGDMRNTSQVLSSHVDKLLDNMRTGNYSTQEALIKEARENIASYEKANKVYEGIPFVDGEQALFDKMREAAKRFQASSEKLFELAQSRDKSAAEAFEKIQSTEFQRAEDDHRIAAGALITFQHNEGEKWVKKSEEAASFGNWLAGLIVVVGFLATQIFGMLFSRGLSKTLTGIATHLGSGAEQVAEASTQIAATSTELSASTTEQAAAIQETVSSLEEVNAMVGKNADNAKESTDVAERSQQTAELGKRAVQDMSSSIDQINLSNQEIMQQVNESNRRMEEIIVVIANIGDKTKVINDIVFQTKLLSFNASVEAARAGEHGKGFAVVAEEVGNLAQMSGNAAKEISEMLSQSSTTVERIVRETKERVERIMAQGSEKLKTGIATAQKCSGMLEEIVGGVTEVGGRIQEIATASREQAQGVQEINKAIAEMGHVTQQNAVATQQASSTAEALNHQAQALRTVVLQLRSLVAGQNSSETPSRTSAPLKISASQQERESRTTRKAA